MEHQKLEGSYCVSVDVDAVKQTNLQGSRTVWFYLKTMFMFTKSDFKTVVIPQSVFALAVVLSHTQTGNIANDFRDLLKWRLPCMLIWIWTHLLVENISNQRLPGSVVEDTVNKPWRPIPAGRITPYEAQKVLRVAVPAAMGLSAILGSFVASVTLMVFIWLYNDLEGSRAGPWQRNVINAAGLSCFGWGAILVLLGGDNLLNDVLCKWLMLLAAVIITTVQAQDLPDMEGDSACGRKTMPILYGQAWSRYGLAVFLLLWSVVCPAFWHVSSPLVWAATLLIGSTMAALTTLRWDPFFDLIRHSLAGGHSSPLDQIDHDFNCLSRVTGLVPDHTLLKLPHASVELCINLYAIGHMSNVAKGLRSEVPWLDDQHLEAWCKDSELLRQAFYGS
ncbi:hypothetical protein G7Y89_g8045 [Cudoniella acicularis]|uniref:Uncharacterized protein n=1 Tax=Cudoniella acicularis TaxID=354080 RepID=A0A8H4RJM1_9HELO|nr:hypothetical protein G7Y89_g8045 [Cudoniella acicularis]